MADMKKFRRAALFTAVLALLIAIGPFFLPEKLQPYDIAGVLRKKPPAWQGVLHLWQVNTWRVGQGSRTALVQSAAKRFEARHIGVYLEIENVTEEVLQNRLKAGELPDIVSFPDGWAGIDTGLLMELDSPAMPELSAPFRTAFNQDKRALPWMAGGQFVLINNAMCRSVGVEPPLAGAEWTSQALLEFARKAATTRRRKPLLALSGSTQSLLPLALQGVNIKALEEKKLLPDKAYTLGIDSAREPYASGRCAALVCTQWEAALMERLAAKSKAFEYSVLPLPNDLRPCLNVQYAAVVATNEENRNTVAAEFVYTLLSEPVQTAITMKSCSLAVVPPKSDIVLEGELEKLLQEQLKHGRVPLAFQKADGQNLIAALGGDKGAALLLAAAYAN
jgi:ABC-type glycerol-3-phosphate transport system substrate-binding protein